MMGISTENQNIINESNHTKSHEASVLINQKVKSEIKQGLVLLLGISSDDCSDDIECSVKRSLIKNLF